MKKRNIILIVMVILITSSIVVAIKNVEKKIDVELENITVTQNIYLTVGENPILIDSYADNSYYNVYSLNTEKDINIKISPFEGYDVTINGIPIKSGESISLHLDKLRKYSDYIEIEFNDLKNHCKRTSYINTLPSDFPSFISDGETELDGAFYFSLNNYAIKMDTNGEILYYQRAEQCMDFKKVVVGEKVRYIYMEQNPNQESLYMSGVEYYMRQAVIRDENYNLVDTVKYLVTDEGKDKVALDGQDFIYLDDYNYIVMGYDKRHVYDLPGKLGTSGWGTRVAACMIQEIKDGEVVWQWDSTDYAELYSLSTMTDFDNQQQYWLDYAHLSSMSIDPVDNNLVCVFKNLDAVIKIDRKTGSLLWILGGSGDQFKLEDTQKFSKPSYAGVDQNGNLIVFDNGVDKQQTRIVIMELDSKNKKIRSYSEYPASPYYVNNMGSAQFVGAQCVLVGWGMNKTNCPIFSVMNYKTKKVDFEVFYPNDLVDLNYRVYFIN